MNKQDIIKFTEFLDEKGYSLRDDEDHVMITYEILCKFIDEYLGDNNIED